jgi:hypothetical protein
MNLDPDEEAKTQLLVEQWEAARRACNGAAATVRCLANLKAHIQELERKHNEHAH